MTATNTPDVPPREPGEESVEKPTDGLLRRTLGKFVVDDWQTALLLPLLAVASALVLSALVIVLSDIDNLERLGSQPGSALSDMGASVFDAYTALARGAFGSLRAWSETLTNATPFIIAGLAVGLGFRAGLFNIGALGQMIAGGLAATWVGISVDLPAFVHLPLALLAGFAAGAAYGAIPGILKAKTGAHEVIVTIMLNNIGLLMLTYVLKTDAFRAAGRTDPISEKVATTARLPKLFGVLDRSDLRVHLGLLLALALAWGVWWLLYQSTIGFEFRAVGFNPSAAAYGGMSVVLLTALVMAISGGLAGLAGANEVLGVQGRAAPGFVGVIGFDAISVALLGRSHPGGIVLSGLLFGALKAGAQEMQAVTNVPVDIIQIVQALIIVFIAAPALIRAVFRIRGEHDEGAGTTIQSGWAS